MKRMLAAAITGTMLLASVLPAAAAPSVQGGGAQQGNIPAQQVVDQETSTDNLLVHELENATVEPLEEGTVVWKELDREKYTEEELEVIDSLNEADAEASVKEAFGELIDLTQMKLFDKNVEVTDEDFDVVEFLDELNFLSPVWELVFDGVEPTLENPVLCTFTVNNLTEDMEVYMLYNCEEHGWELLSAEIVADNQVEVAVHSTSAPAALVYRLAEEQDADAEGTSPVAAEAETEEMTEED